VKVSTYPEDKLVSAMCGNTSAVAFVCLLAKVFHLWDDLIDKDHVVSDDEINTAMTHALITIPTNEFYQQHFWALQPVIRNAIINWQIATRLERSSNETNYPIAFILRSSAVDIITACATILGGVDHGIRVGQDIHLFAHRETLNGYLTNLAAEKAARESRE
jgi:hypothetical protein